MQRVQRVQRADLRHLGLHRRLLCGTQPGLCREHLPGARHLKRHAVRFELGPQPFPGWSQGAGGFSGAGVRPEMSLG